MANTPYIDLVKPAGTDKALISVLNANSDKIDSAVGGVQDALAIVCNGNTHGAITAGQYVYVRAHETLQEGLYKANSNIAANAALNSTNLTADSSGGLNSLNEQIANIITVTTYTKSITVAAGTTVYIKGQDFDTPISIPSGKIGIVVGFDSGNPGLCVTFAKAIAGNNYAFVVRNVTGASITDTAMIMIGVIG